MGSNDNLIKDMTPIRFDSTEIFSINKSWFDKQSSQLQTDLVFSLLDIGNEFGNTTVKTITISDFNIKSHSNCDFDIYSHPMYYAFMKIYKTQYMFDKFAHIFTKPNTVKTCQDHQNSILLTDSTKYKHYGIIYNCVMCANSWIEPECTIINLTNSMCDGLIGLHIDNSSIDKIPIELINTIDNVLKIYADTGAFVKTSLKSSKKNNKGIRISPCFTVQDVLVNLTLSKQILQSLLFGCNLIIRKWLDIAPSNEFRVYVLDRKIKCICQQSLTKIIVDKMDPTYVIEQISNFYEYIKTQIDYNDCVIDLYVGNFCVNLNLNVKLIEINSGGAWSTAGAGLFTWEQIINAQSITLKYL
jgi:hypothetical protein